MRFAHDLNYFPQENTIIVNYQLSIVHYARQRDKSGFNGIDFFLCMCYIHIHNSCEEDMFKK